MAGGVYSTNPTYGTRFAFVPKGHDAIYRILAQADMLIDETYYVGIPSIKNITSGLGFATVAQAMKAVPAIGTGDIFRWGFGGGVVDACIC
jgi:hypothetical protein